MHGTVFCRWVSLIFGHESRTRDVVPKPRTPRRSGGTRGLDVRFQLSVNGTSSEPVLGK